MPATTQDPSSPSSGGVSIYLYTRLIDETSKPILRPKESAWYLITPTSESGQDLSPVFPDVPPPADGFDIRYTGRAVIGSKLYLIGGCHPDWGRGNPTPYYSAVRCLDTRQSPSQGWKTISSLPLGFKIGRTAVSAPWIYVFGCSKGPRGELPRHDNLISPPWGYAINVDNPEETFPLPKPYPQACPDMCAVLEEGLLIYEGAGDTLLLFNLKDRSYSVYQMPDIIPTNENYSACTYSCGIFYCYHSAGFILAYDTVHRVRLPTYKIQREWYELFEVDAALSCLFSASNGKIGLLLYQCVSLGFMSVIYVEFSMLYGDSVEMVVHRTRKFGLRGDDVIDIVPCYDYGDELNDKMEAEQVESSKSISKKKKKKKRQEQQYRDNKESFPCVNELKKAGIQQQEKSNDSKITREEEQYMDYNMAQTFWNYSYETCIGNPELQFKVLYDGLNLLLKMQNDTNTCLIHLEEKIAKMEIESSKRGKQH